jgi:dienelactone hydrolase
VHLEQSSEFRIERSTVKSYVSYPKDKSTKNTILFLPDAFGLEFVNNKLLADDFARAGYFTVIPDIFNGDPVPFEHLISPGSKGPIDIMAWVGTHPIDSVDPIVEKTIKGLKSLGAENIGAVGYCFGAKYVVRFLAQGRGVDAGFIAHPSFVSAEELEASKGPLSIAAAGEFLLFFLFLLVPSHSTFLPSCCQLFKDSL